jgi:putative two-component system response regulator
MTRVRTDKILVVDDEPSVGQVMCDFLEMGGYRSAFATSAEDALSKLSDEPFSLVLSDIQMPGMSGMDLLEIVKEKYPQTAVMIVTGLGDREIASRALRLGAYGYIIKPLDMTKTLIDVENALERHHLTLMSEDYEKSLEALVNARTRQIKDREEELVIRLISALGLRDHETGSHVKRIGLYSAELARYLGWSTQEVEKIRLSAPMHDIGKIGVPDSILKKPGRLTEQEIEIIKTHTTLGAFALQDSEVPILQMAYDIALSHHERWDGTGYPQGLRGEEIPECALIVSVVDVYDALVHDRVYRSALSNEEALKIIEEAHEASFGPVVYPAFLSVFPALVEINASVKDNYFLSS